MRDQAPISRRDRHPAPSILALSLLALLLSGVGCRLSLSRPPARTVTIQRGGDEGNSAQPPETPPARDPLEIAIRENNDVREVVARPVLAENMVFLVGAGARDGQAGSASAFANVGVAYGAPLWSAAGVRWQADGQFGRREGERFDSRISLGLFYRSPPDPERAEGRFGPLDLQAVAQKAVGGGVYADYVRTRDDSDLFGLHGILGFSPIEDHHLGLISRFSLNKERVEAGRRAGIGERILVRHDVTWGCEWSEVLATELSVGYQGGHIRGLVTGIRIGALLRQNVSLRPSFESNFEGDYAAGLQLVWEFGGQRRPLLLTRYGSQSESDHTPFLPADLSLIHLDRD